MKTNNNNNDFLETITLNRKSYDELIFDRLKLNHYMEREDNLLNVINSLRNNLLDYIIKNNIYIKDIIDKTNIYSVSLNKLLDINDYHLQEEYAILNERFDFDIDRIKALVSDIYNENTNNDIK